MDDLNPNEEEAGGKQSLEGEAHEAVQENKLKRNRKPNKTYDGPE